MIQPQNDWILVQLDEVSDKVANGLLFKPETAHETIHQTGEVIKVGPGKLSSKGDRIPLGVGIGEGVLFSKFVATKTKTAEALEYHLDAGQALIRESDVMVVYDRTEGAVLA